jgi:hypothetical protein
MSNRKIFDADASRNLVVQDAVTNGGQNAQKQNLQRFHSRFGIPARYPHSGKPQPPMPQGLRMGASQMGKLEPPPTWAAGTLNRLASFAPPHSGQRGASPPRNSSSKSRRQLSQEYSYIGIVKDS